MKTEIRENTLEKILANPSPFPLKKRKEAKEKNTPILLPKRDKIFLGAKIKISSRKISAVTRRVEPPPSPPARTGRRDEAKERDNRRKTKTNLKT